jgi:NADH:ubiquinone oxidoreductase subunit F (NADH-binding)/NAD-dependent dihydropyrimidine dehydrogenase PreA subunit/(2Fe-2S) ferredoxin
MINITTLQALNEIKEQGLQSLYPAKIKITVGTATCGLSTGAGKTLKAIVEEVRKEELDAVVGQTGCLGFCQKEPLVDVLEPKKPRLFYAEITQERVQALIHNIKRGEVTKDYVLCKMCTEEFLIDNEKKEYPISDDFKDIPLYEELPFFAKQKKIALRNCGFIDPERIEHYIAKGGYYTLYNVLTTMSPEDVIEEIKKSGLRGRGGAGFPTGIKWDICRKAEGTPKYIICNADEGDPGAYMDRSILEGDPHSVVEGMIIGAFGIGAHEGYIYVRTEYPLAIMRLKKAIEQARDYGLLGTNIFGHNFNFDLKIAQGAGAFVCGEETSLIASIEGNIPEPKLRPPFPAESGLFKKPTNINNVETWANVPVIITRGADWFSHIGTANSTGTKVFSLVAKVKNTGLVEIPMGMTLRDIIYEIGEGIPGDKKFKAVQTGGPSGGCVPKELIDLPIDYENLTKAGSIMGSGGMVVIDEDTCVVDLAKFFLDFTRDESCGKCTSCREGIDAMLNILNKISRGEGKEEDLTFLEELGNSIRDVSLCGLGQTAPNPVLSTLRYFRHEYRAHIEEKRCPALVCKALISYVIDPALCGGCTVCAKNCPNGAIIGESKVVHTIDQSKCTKCGICIASCPPTFNAIKIVSPVIT